MKNLLIIGDSQTAPLAAALRTALYKPAHFRASFLACSGLKADWIGYESGEIFAQTERFQRASERLGNAHRYDLSNFDCCAVVVNDLSLPRIGSRILEGSDVVEDQARLDACDPSAHDTTLVTRAFLEAALAARMSPRLAFLVITRLRAQSDLPILFVPAPNIKQNLLASHEMKAQLMHIEQTKLRAILVESYNVALVQAFGGIEDMAIIRQLPCTIADEIYTDARYFQNAPKMDNPEKTFKETDFAHPNADYGAHILRLIDAHPFLQS